MYNGTFSILLFDPIENTDMPTDKRKWFSRFCKLFLQSMELREKDALMASVVEHNTDAIITMDPDDLKDFVQSHPDIIEGTVILLA